MALTWLYLFCCIFSNSSTVGTSTPESQDKRIHVMTSVNKLARNRAACSLNYRKDMTIGRHVFLGPEQCGPVWTGLDPDRIKIQSGQLPSILQTFSGLSKREWKRKNEKSDLENTGTSGESGRRRLHPANGYFIYFIILFWQVWPSFDRTLTNSIGEAY